MSVLLASALDGSAPARSPLPRHAASSTSASRHSVTRQPRSAASSIDQTAPSAMPRAQAAAASTPARPACACPEPASTAPTSTTNVTREFARRQLGCAQRFPSPITQPATMGSSALLAANARLVCVAVVCLGCAPPQGSSARRLTALR
jgi:hypothetical protein